MNCIPFICFFLAQFHAFAYQEFTLSEIGGDRVEAAKSNQHWLLLDLAQFPKQDLLVFNFKSETFRLVKDERIKRGVRDLCSWEGGFALFIRPTLGEGALVILNHEGIFQESAKFVDLEGMGGDLNFTHFSNYKDHQILVTYEKGMAWQTSFLGVLDTRTKRLTQVAQVNQTDQQLSSYWLACGDRVYLFSPYTGLIRSVDKNFQPLKTLHKAETPQPTKQNTDTLPAKYKGALFLQFNPRLGFVFEHHDFVDFARFHQTDKKVTKHFMGREIVVNETLTSYYSLKEEHLAAIAQPIIGTFKGKVLSFDTETGSFNLSGS